MSEQRRGSDSPYSRSRVQTNSSIRSPVNAAGASITGSPRSSRIISTEINHENFDIPLNIENDEFNWEQALRMLSTLRGFNTSSRGNQQNDTANCKEWLVYLKLARIEVESMGVVSDVSENVSIKVSYANTSKTLFSKSKIFSVWDFFNSYKGTKFSLDSNNSLRDEVAYNLYDYYGHDVISIEVFSKKINLFSQLKVPISKYELSMSHIYNSQSKISEETEDNNNLSSCYLVPVIVCCQVPISRLIQSGISPQCFPSSIGSADNAILKITLGTRLVSLAKCCNIFNYRHPKSSIDPGHGLISDHIHELHVTAAYAPPYLLVNLLQSLARKSYLRRSMLILSSESMMSPLDIALLQGNYKNSKILLERMGHLCFNRSLVGGRSSAMHYAVRSGNPRCVKLLIKYVLYYGPIPVTNLGRDASVRLVSILDWRDENDFTPLLLACKLASNVSWFDANGKKCDTGLYSGRTTVVSTLLRFRADCSIVSAKTSESTLIAAVKYADSTSSLQGDKSSSKYVNTDVIQLIFKIKKPRKDIKNLISKRPIQRENMHLFTSFFSRSSSQQNGSPLKKTIDGQSYEELVSSDNPYDKKNIFTLQIPLSHLKCNVYHKDLNDKSAFAYAVESGNLSLIKLFVSKGLSYMESLDGNGSGIIHICAKYGHEDIIDYIAGLEYERYRKYRKFLHVFPVQLIHYRLKIFQMKNALGLTPFDVALLTEQTNKAQGDIQSENNVSSKIAYYSHIIYEPPVNLSSKSRDDSKSFVAFSTTQKSTEGILPSESEARKQMAGWSNSFNSLMSMLLPTGIQTQTLETEGSKTSINTKKGLQMQQLNINLQRETEVKVDEIEYDDIADNLAFEFALAAKAGVSQGYYNIAEIENSKLGEKEVQTNHQSQPALNILSS